MDRQRLREEKKNALFATPLEAQFELFMKRATLKSLEYSEAQIKAVDEAAEELGFLADKVGIACNAYESLGNIVQAILEAGPASVKKR